MSGESGAAGAGAAASSGGEAAAGSTAASSTAASTGTSTPVAAATPAAEAAPAVDSPEGAAAKETKVDKPAKTDEGAPKEGDNPSKKQLKEWAKENLEQDFDDDDIADDWVREFAGNSHKLNKQLIQVFDENPEAGAIISAMVKDGKPFLEALAEFVSPEEFAEYLNGSDKSKEAQAKRKQAQATQKALEAEIGKNKEESEKSLTAFMGKHNMDEKAVADLFDKTILPVYQGLLNQKFTEETWEKFFQLHNYKTDVSDAQKLGAAKANNAKIKIEKDKDVSDGLPQINGGGSAAIVEKVVKKMSMVARVAAENEAMRKRQ